MTFAAKVLVVITLILSVVYATMSGVLYSRRMNYQKALDEAKATLVTRINSLRAEKKDAEDKLAKMTSDFRVKSTEADQTAMELRNQKEINDRLKVQVKEKTDENIRVAADKDAMQALLKTAEQRRDQVEQELVTRRKHLNETREELDKARAEISDLNRKLAQTQDERNKLATANTALQERLRVREQQVAALREKYYYDTALQRVLDSEFTTAKDIQGKVVYVDQETGSVFINKGTADDVLKDYVFTVYREDQFVARIRIVELHPKGNLAVGKVVTQKLPVQRGDTVATRLIP